jgi:hypothetical protein
MLCLNPASSPLSKATVVSVQNMDTCLERRKPGESLMSHPFGDLISQHLHRKHGLSQDELLSP